MIKWKYSNISKRYKGGGGSPGTTQTESTIPKEFIPGLLRTQDKAEDLYGRGELGKVAGQSGLQREAFTSGIGGVREAVAANKETLTGQRQRLGSMAETGGADELKAALDLDVGMGAAKIGQDYGASGTLGSYRQNLASATAEDATKAKFAQQVIQNKAAAEQGLNTNAAALSADQANLLKSLEATGAAERGIDQQQLDANWQAYQRLASSMYGNPARQQTVAVPGSSGGK